MINYHHWQFMLLFHQSLISFVRKYLIELNFIRQSIMSVSCFGWFSAFDTFFLSQFCSWAIYHFFLIPKVFATMLQIFWEN